MYQPQMDRDKTWLVVFLAIFAFSSLGFAVLGLVLSPELTLELQERHLEQVEIINRPQVPELSLFVEFWQAAGYDVMLRDGRYDMQKNERPNGREIWVQGQETWVLVPRRYDQRLSTSIFALCGDFLEQGWLIQIEATLSGYTIGFWSGVPGLDHKVLAFLWHIELLNPRNYGDYSMGYISVMGESFDPEGFLRGTPQAPVLAMIIDDWGHAGAAMDPLIAYPFPLTVAILPHLVLSSHVGERAHAAGHEVILHQPMEAQNTDLDLGPGGITVAMDPEDLGARLRENLASLPMVVGLNNHMGSLVTEDLETMTSILQVTKELGLFFVDSRTTNLSVVAEAAHAVEVPFGVNNLFIDNESDVEKIKTQVRAGLALAKKQGHAVVIGHVRPVTAAALWEMIPELLASGVQFVPISHLLQH